MGGRKAVLKWGTLETILNRHPHKRADLDTVMAWACKSGGMGLRFLSSVASRPPGMLGVDRIVLNVRSHPILS
jgi:hypothetical protein